jgi:tRNA-Thr(GGU) m(6)t(6)A37 methyltransferase TsaA
VEIRPVAYIRTEFPEKFGIPRQSGLASGLRGKIVFQPSYRNPDALRGLDNFSHIWLIWEFNANRDRNGQWQPTVRPPRLGGNMHMGVFATRSPFRPNPLGLSCVQIESIELNTSDGPVINVLGADLMDGTPIYDIKPYLKYSDSHPDSSCGYVDGLRDDRLDVVIPSHLLESMPDTSCMAALEEVLSLDPRPSYHSDPEREYGLSFAGYNIKFTVKNNILTVNDIKCI